MAETARTIPLDRIPDDGFVIEFQDVSVAQANQFAEELEQDVTNALAEENARAKVDTIKPDATTQDVGSVLAIILGAKATVALAIGIARWLNRGNQAAIHLKKKDGTTISITGLKSEDVQKALKELNVKEVKL